jgi:hypothetical protein
VPPALPRRADLRWLARRAGRSLRRAVGALLAVGAVVALVGVLVLVDGR